MIGWLLNWWRTRARQNHRALFEFFDGQRFRRADPWPIYRAIYNDEHFVPGEMMAAAAELEEPEFSKAVACAHRALGTKPYDAAKGVGLTETEAFATMIEFMEWCAELVKKNGGFATSLPPTDSTSSPGPECPSEPTSSPLLLPSPPDGSTPSEALSSSTA